MKIIKKASGRQTIKISKSEWELIGKKYNWIKKADYSFGFNEARFEEIQSRISNFNYNLDYNTLDGATGKFSLNILQDDVNYKVSGVFQFSWEKEDYDETGYVPGYVSLSKTIITSIDPKNENQIMNIKEDIEYFIEYMAWLKLEDEMNDYLKKNEI